MDGILRFGHMDIVLVWRIKWGTLCLIFIGILYRYTQQRRNIASRPTSLRIVSTRLTFSSGRAQRTKNKLHQLTAYTMRTCAPTDHGPDFCLLSCKYNGWCDKTKIIHTHRSSATIGSVKRTCRGFFSTRFFASSPTAESAMALK